MLNRQRQQHVREQLAQLEGELAQLATDEREGDGGGVGRGRPSRNSLRAELEPETELHAQMRGLAEVRPPDPCRRL